MVSDLLQLPNKFIGNIEIATENEIGDFDWNGALQACEQKGDGWRLPNLKELEGIFQNRDIAVNGSEWYWSAKQYYRPDIWKKDIDKDSLSACIYNLCTGEFSWAGKTNKGFNVRCIRDIDRVRD